MKKQIAAVLMLGLLAPAWSIARAEVPHTINLQSIVYDASGNITKSDKVDVSVKILDADNNVVFSEDHSDVQVIEGAINLDIGSESGGVPLEALDPTTGTKLIDVLIDGANPFDLMPLGAVPYAMWAEKALTVADESIGTEQIKNGSIKAEDIDPLAFSDIQGQAAEGQIPGSVATDAELNAHINSGTAHPASAIVVSGSFITFVADDVQEALQKLDQKLADEIVNRQNAISTINASITTLQTQMSTANTNITNLQTQMTTVTADLSTKVSKSGDTMTDDLAFNPGSGETLRIDAPTGNITTTGTISAYGGTMSGPLNMGGNNITNVPDDASVPHLSGGNFNVGRALHNHETRLTALEGAGIIVVDGYVEWQTNTNNANGGALSGADAPNWSLSGDSTFDDKWVTITRAPITIPNNCVAIVSGTATPHVASGDQTFFDDDDQSFLRINYSGQQINLTVFGLGNDGDFDINFRVIVQPTVAGTNCSPL